MTTILDDVMARRLRQAQDYLEEARELLSAGPNGALALSPASWDELAARARIYILFPSLDEKQRCLLLALYLQHRVLWKLINMARADLSFPLKAQWEKVTDMIERQYMGILAAAKRIIHFQELQRPEQQLFEHEFSPISFCEESQ
jgi:hypothetical protein